MLNPFSSSTCPYILNHDDFCDLAHDEVFVTALLFPGVTGRFFTDVSHTVTAAASANTLSSLARRAIFYSFFLFSACSLLNVHVRVQVIF